jgi:hypothetical protein
VNTAGVALLEVRCACCAALQFTCDVRQLQHHVNKRNFLREQYSCAHTHGFCCCWHLVYVQVWVGLGAVLPHLLRVPGALPAAAAACDCCADSHHTWLPAYSYTLQVVYRPRGLHTTLQAY